MEIAAESGLGTTLLGNLMVANRHWRHRQSLPFPISRLLLRGMRGLAGRMQRGLVVMTGPIPKSDQIEAQYRAEHGPEDGLWVEAGCVMSGESTRLRCGGCHTPVCHRHDSCPNGCDA